MKIAITMPVWIQDNPALIDQTIKAASKLETIHDAQLFVACTRLHQIAPQELERRVREACPIEATVLHQPGVERSVAGAWNWGCRYISEVDYMMVVANDVEVDQFCIDELVSYGEAHPEASIWSGLHYGHNGVDPYAVHECCDFSCFMLRPSTFDRFGTFDENYRPAYFEDNDYYTRIIVGGGSTRMAPSARFHHYGSLTIRSEGEAAHHVQHWWGINKARYAAKWGPAEPPSTPSQIRELCYSHPWNDSSLPVGFWQR